MGPPTKSWYIACNVPPWATTRIFSSGSSCSIRFRYPSTLSNISSYVSAPSGAMYASGSIKNARMLGPRSSTRLPSSGPKSYSMISSMGSMSDSSTPVMRDAVCIALLSGDAQTRSNRMPSASRSAFAFMACSMPSSDSGMFFRPWRRCFLLSAVWPCLMM